MQQTTERDTFIRQHTDRMFKSGSRLLILVGASCFPILSLLDAVVAPAMFRLFLQYRIGISIFLAGMFFFVRKFEHASIKLHYFLTHLGIFAAAATVEMMILHLDGHASGYYVGQILVAVLTIALLPASLAFHVRTALIVYLTYLIPILVFDTLTQMQPFLTANIFMIMISGGLLISRFQEWKTLRSEIGLQYDLLDRINEQKQAEEALRESEHRFRTVFNGVSDGMILLDIKTHRFVMVNQTICAMLGYTEDELCALPPDELHPAETRQHAIHAREDAAQRPASFTKDSLIKRKDGSVFYADIGASMLTINGRLHLLGVFRDVTARRQTEEKLRRYAMAVEQSIDGIAIADMNGTLTFANNTWCRMHGFELGELVGKHLSIGHTTQQMEQDVEPFNRAVLEKGAHQGEVGHLRKDGTTFPTWMSTTILKDDMGNPVGLLGIARDITEHKEAQQRFERIFHANPALMALSHADQRLADVNEAWLQALGYSREEVIGRTPAELGLFVAPELQGEAGRTLRATGRLRNVEMQVRRRDGAILDGLFSGEMIGLPGKQYALTVMIDITERKRTAEEQSRLANTLAVTFDAVNDALFIHDSATGAILDVNARMCEMYGYQHDEALQLTIDELSSGTPPYTQSEGVGWITKAATGVPQLFEWHARRKDGILFWVEVNMRLAAIGGEDRVIVAVRDITERKRAEVILQARLRVNEFTAGHSLDETLQNALDEICVLTESPIGFFHFVAPDERTLSLQAWSTRTVKEFCSAKGKGIHYDIDQAGVWVDAIRRREPVIHNDYANLPHRKGLPQGHATVVREMVFPIMRNNKIVALIGVGNKEREYTEVDVNYASRFADMAWDITERKRAEEAILHAKEEWERTFDASSDPIMLLGTDFRIIRANKVMAELMGMNKEEAVGKICYEHVHKASEPPPYCPHKLLLDDGKPNTTELYEPGLGRHLMVTVSPIFDAEGKLMGSVHYAKDISDRKWAEEKMLSQLNELRRWQDVMLDREARVLDLKREVNELLTRLNEPLRYGSVPPREGKS